MFGNNKTIHFDQETLSEQFTRAIDHEQKEDIEQTKELLNSLPLKTLVNAGLAINNLYVENVKTGLGGKIYVELKQSEYINNGELNRGDFKNGDIVVLSKNPSGGGKASQKQSAKSVDINCVIFKINSSKITLTVDSGSGNDASSAKGTAEQQQVQSLESNDSNILYYLVKTTNEITYKRMLTTMKKLKELDPLQSDVAQILLCQYDYRPKKPTTASLKEMKFFNNHLNDSQKYAIKFAMDNPVSIIHGPPGTGKTYTLVEIVQQLYHADPNSKTLICGPSNISVDTILERLSSQTDIISGNKLLRIGHPARLLNFTHSLDVLAKTGDNGYIINDIRGEIDTILGKIKKLKTYKERKQSWSEIKLLRQDLRQREEKIIVELIKQSNVIVSTLHGSSSKNLLKIYDYFKAHPEQKTTSSPSYFDTLIIDEVSQSLEPQCWIPLLYHFGIKKIIIAGDNKQLPPTVKTEENKKCMDLLSTTIFDRLEAYYGDLFKNLLNVQYRMNTKIMEFSSEQLYAGKLIADESVRDRVLSDLPGVDTADITKEPLLWYDTQGDDFLERNEELEDQENGGTFNSGKSAKSSRSKILMSSKYNENEAYLVLKHIKDLVNENVPQEAIGVISPYNAQVSFLKKIVHASYPLIEISTIDGFQGREKECIILSLVRSNDSFEVGFLKDERRLNVAMTRPKRQLCVVGNMETLQRSRNKFLKSWADWSEENMEIIYPDLDDLL